MVNRNNTGECLSEDEKTVKSGNNWCLRVCINNTNPVVYELVHDLGIGGFAFGLELCKTFIDLNQICYRFTFSASYFMDGSSKVFIFIVF